MANLSDYIEAYIKDLFTQARKHEIEIQRNELAEKFRCVPSQINYVLSTRFNHERGYVVESRRGGGGYIRIVKLTLNNNKDVMNIITNAIGEDISQNEGHGIIQRLWEHDVITNREASILFAIIDKSTIAVELPKRDFLRARLLKAALLAVLRDNC